MSESQNHLNDSQNTSVDQKLNNMTGQEKTTPSVTPQTPERTSSKFLMPAGSDGQKWMTQRNRTALDNFEEAVGGRDVLIDSLAMYNLDKKQEHFVRLLCDPARIHDSLVTICRDAGLNPIALFDLFTEANRAKGTALAMARMATKLPEVAEDILQKSVDAKVECPSCFGEGFIAEDVKCPQCYGKGKILRESDIDRQKMVSEITGLQKKGPGVQVNTAVQVNNAVTAPNLFSKYVKSSDEAAYDVVDAQVEEVE